MVSETRNYDCGLSHLNDEPHWPDVPQPEHNCLQVSVVQSSTVHGGVLHTNI